MTELAAPQEDEALDAPAGTDPAPDDLAVDDGEDIEHEGRTYRVPRALKDAFLRQADYTRKTQELAEQRRGLEQQGAQLRAAEAADLQDQARLAAVNDDVRRFEQLDWAALERQDPQRAQSLWRQYSQLKDSRTELIGQLRERRDQRALDAQRDAARRVEEGQAVLSRDIQGWSPELASTLSDFGQREFGFTAEEIGGVVDPRMVKVLHLAFLGRQAQQTQAAARKAQAAQSAQPIRQVGSQASARRPATTDAASDRLSTDDWFKAEQDRMRRRAGR